MSLDQQQLQVQQPILTVTTFSNWRSALRARLASGLAQHVIDRDYTVDYDTGEIKRDGVEEKEKVATLFTKWQKAFGTISFALYPNYLHYEDDFG